MPFIAAAFGRGAEGHMSYILEGTRHPLPFLASSLPALLVVLVWSKRLPDAGRLTRFIWGWGRWFLIASAVLDASFILVFDRSFHKDMEMAFLGLDAAVIGFLFLSNRVKDVFDDFPVPEEPSTHKAIVRSGYKPINYIDEAFGITERMALEDASGEISELLQAVKSAENISAGNWSGLGVRAAEAGKLEDASFLFQAAAQIEPENHIHSRNLCEIFRRLRLHHDAVRYGLTAIRLAPEDPVSHFNLALVQSEYHQNEFALASYRQAVSLAPFYIEAWNNMVLLLKTMGRKEEAQAVFQHALNIQSAQTIQSNT